MHGFFDPVPPPGPDRKPATPSAADHQCHRQPRHAAQAPWNLHLESAGTDIAARFLADSPSLAVLAVEDLCWQAAAEDWKHRRPHWWQPRSRAAWRAEGARLAAKADRLRQMADDVSQEL